MKIPCFKNKHVGLLILRLFVGGIFLVHGIQKLSDMNGAQGTVAFFGQIGLNAFWAWVTALVETLGGLMLVLGLFVQYTSILLSIIMLVAIFYVKIPAILSMIAQSGQEFSFWVKSLAVFGQIEVDLALLGANLALVFTGAGRFATSKWCKCHKDGLGCKVCKVMGCEHGVCGEQKCSEKKCEKGVCGVDHTHDDAPKA